MAVAQANFKAIAERTGCQLSASRVVECLQAMPADTLSIIVRENGESTSGRYKYGDVLFVCSVRANVHGRLKTFA